MLKFNPTRLTRLERESWTTFVDEAGDAGIAAMFQLMVCWVAKLIREGKTGSEARENVLGTFYDNVSLMRSGQGRRNKTIALATAMVEQAVELFATAPRASPELINVDNRTGSEAQEIHDQFQEIQQGGPGTHSIADFVSREQEAQGSSTDIDEALEPE